jgi:hypothetical protein
MSRYSQVGASQSGRVSTRASGRLSKGASAFVILGLSALSWTVIAGAIFAVRALF